MPKSLEDPVLGFLKWDDRLQWWIGEIDLVAEQSVEIFISPRDDSPEATLPRVRAAVERIRRKDLEYRSWTARQVLEDRWNSEEAMSVEEITELLHLASIDFHSDGRAGLYWNDDDRLYGGHNLITELNADGQCIEVRIEG